MSTATQRHISEATIIQAKSRDEWLTLRRSYLGASDAASIWGASGWQSPYSVWWSKVGPAEHDEPDIVQRVGHAMEGLIAELVTEATGLKLYDPGDYTLYVSSEVPYMACTPDRLTADGTMVVELKTAHFAAAEQWKERIPLAYQCQLAHQMICCGVDRALIGVLINSTTFKHHSMRLSPNFAKRHKAKCLSFWREYVETETAPPADYSKATSQALLKQWQDSRDVTVDLPDDMAGLGERFDKLARTAAAVERHQEHLKNRVKAAMQDAQIGRLPGEDSGFSWKGSNGRRIFKRKAKIYDDQR